MPLLHAGAGHLTRAAADAWHARPQLGPRFEELASALRQSSSVPPGTIARLMRAAAECESLDADAPVPDIARALDQLAALPPEAPLPLSAAVLLTMTADGYLAAPAQSALLEAYGGGALAAAVQTLADEARDHFTPIAPRQGQANDRQNRRRRSGQRRRRTRRSREHTASVDDPADSGAVPTCPRPAAVEAEAAWEALDGVDLQDELRHPVPTLQDVPPFLRAAVRGALVKALAHLHAALVAGQGNSASAGRACRAPGTPGRARQGATPRKGTGLPARGVVAVAGSRTAQHASRDAASARRGGSSGAEARAGLRQGPPGRAFSR